MSETADDDDPPLSEIRESLHYIGAEFRSIGGAVQGWYQDRHFLTQVAIVVGVWFGTNAAYNYISPIVWAALEDSITAVLGFRITGLTVIQFIIILLGYIIAQNFILIRRVDQLEERIQNMDQPSPVTDGGGQPRDEQGRFKEKGTSGGGFIGGAIIGGSLGASYGPGGMLAGALAGALLGDALEQQSSEND